MFFFVKAKSKNLPVSRQFFKLIGVYPIGDHYYQPLFNDKHLAISLREPRSLPGIDFIIRQQLSLLQSLVFEDEINGLGWLNNSSNPLEFNFNNGSFESGDAQFLYQIIRYFKPTKIIEIGSGHSTKVANLAVTKNHQESGVLALHTCIEPFEMPWLEELNVSVIRSLLQDCDINMFEQLGRNDILFIDSSHIIRPQGDVLQEYLNIIPRLSSGVIVHVHDIFSPRDYLDQWVKEDVLFWNEQYLLECMLTNSQRYEILAALNLLCHDHYESLKKVCPYLEEHREPGSFYFRVK